MPHKSFSVRAGELARLVPPALAGMAVLLTACASGPGGRQGGEIAKPASKSGPDFALLPPPKASAGKYPQPVPVDRLPKKAYTLFRYKDRAYHTPSWRDDDTLYYSDPDGVRKLVPHCPLKNREESIKARTGRLPNDDVPMILVLCEQISDAPFFTISKLLQGNPPKTGVSRIAVTLFRGDQIVTARDDFGMDSWHVESVSVHGAARPAIFLTPRYGREHLATIRADQTLDVIALKPGFVFQTNDHLEIVSEIGLAGPAPLIAWKQKKRNRQTRKNKQTPVRLFSVNRDGTLKKRAKIDFERHLQHPDSDGGYEYFSIGLHDDLSIIITNSYRDGLEILAFNIINGRAVKQPVLYLNMKGMINIDRIKTTNKNFVFSLYYHWRKKSSCIEIDKTPGQPIAIAPCPSRPRTKTP